MLLLLLLMLQLPSLFSGRLASGPFMLLLLAATGSAPGGRKERRPSPPPRPGAARPPSRLGAALLIGVLPSLQLPPNTPLGGGAGLLSGIGMDRPLRMLSKEAFAQASGGRLGADADAVRVVVPVDRGPVTTTSCCVSVLLLGSLLESCERQT